SAAFPFAVSTRLYPEWPFLALPHVDKSVVKAVCSDLLGLEPLANPRNQVEMLSWVAPVSYRAVRTSTLAEVPRESASVEYWAPSLVGVCLLAALGIGAEVGRRRRKLPATLGNLRNFPSCVLATYSVGIALTMIMLLICACERIGEVIARAYSGGS